MARSRLEMKVSEDEKTRWPKEVSSESQWRRGEVALVADFSIAWPHRRAMRPGNWSGWPY